jgi:hypothetical protein
LDNLQIDSEEINQENLVVDGLDDENIDSIKETEAKEVMIQGNDEKNKKDEEESLIGNIDDDERVNVESETVNLNLTNEKSNGVEINNESKIDGLEKLDEFL